MRRVDYNQWQNMQANQVEKQLKLKKMKIFKNNL